MTEGTITTLGQWASPDMAITARERLRRKAQEARDAMGAEGRDHAAALEALGDYLGGCSNEDPRMWALAELAACYGDRDVFHCGPMQDELLGRLAGWRSSAPHLDVTVSELIAAGIKDLAEALNDRTSEAMLERDVANNELAELREKATEGEEAIAELVTAQARIEELTAQRNEAERQARYLRVRYGADDDKERPKSRRRKLQGDGMDGIYVADTSDGEVYEIGWTDAEKRQRWKRLGTDLEEAVELRKELHGKPHEEAVAA